MENLTEKVLHYQKTGEGLRELVTEIAPRVYQFPRRTMGWDEDACGEFYVFAHPRILRLLDRFRDQGRPFESYLWAVLNWQLRNYARERRQKERAWRVSLRMDGGELFQVDRADGGGADAAGGAGGADGAGPQGRLPLPSVLRGVIRTPADRRNFLFLVLKCSCTLDPTSVDPLAALAAVTRERLLDLVGTLRDMRSERVRRLELFRCRRNRSFARVLLIETELGGEVDPLRRADLREARVRALRCMRSAALHMGRVGLAPTNREIARVLEVPKGTVDSGLYWLKKKLAAVYDPDSLRTA